MLLLGLLVAPLARMVLALMTGRQVGWMAVVTALELVFMLRMGTLGPAGCALHWSCWAPCW